MAELSPEAKALLTRLSQGPQPVVDEYSERLRNYSIHRKWLAAAWILGASYGQLSKLYGVTRATICQSVEKVLPVEDRRALKRTALSWTPLVWYKDRFAEHVQYLAPLAPKEIAEWLLNNQPFTED